MRISSGIQPSGEIHLGNYIGALRHWVARQKEFESFYLLADLHAITVARDPKILRDRTLSTAALLFAIRVDPARSAVFVQSHVSEHAELAWILNYTATFGELRRMTQFKDKVGRKETTTVGLFAFQCFNRPIFFFISLTVCPSAKTRSSISNLHVISLCGSMLGLEKHSRFQNP